MGCSVCFSKLISEDDFVKVVCACLNEFRLSSPTRSFFFCFFTFCLCFLNDFLRIQIASCAPIQSPRRSALQRNIRLLTRVYTITHLCRALRTNRLEGTLNPIMWHSCLRITGCNSRERIPWATTRCARRSRRECAACIYITSSTDRPCVSARTHGRYARSRNCGITVCRVVEKCVRKSGRGAARSFFFHWIPLRFPSHAARNPCHDFN